MGGPGSGPRKGSKSKSKSRSKSAPVLDMRKALESMLSRGRQTKVPHTK